MSVFYQNLFIDIRFTIVKDCNSCGKCCIKYGAQDLAVTEQEIESWQIFEPEIAEYIRNGQVWFDPKTGKRLNQCPWLKQTDNKYLCSIYLSRPGDCRYYPTTVKEMVIDECEMIELSDLSNQQKAQFDLDILMTDSRPPLRK